MKDVSRPISLSLFVLVLLCFLLPFARITCQGTNGRQEVVVQANGYEVAFGKTVPAQSDTTGGRHTWEGRPAQPDLIAIAILVAALVGIGLTMLKGRRGAVVRGIYSGHCLLLPLALWFELQGKGGQLHLLAGYWATIALFAAACIVNLVTIPSLPRAPTPPAGTGTDIGPDGS
jgi:hypothetical protein